jgi:hypothetical protein
VKNQYFADRRDLFKWDVLLDVVESHGANSLTYVPMLTPNDDSGEGRLTQSDGRERRVAVFEFLKGSLESGTRDIKRLRDLMPKLGIAFNAHRDDAWFVQHTRREYFDAVPAEYLARSVIFFDPDTGLETRSQSYMRGKGPEKYLLYSELCSIWDRASDDSAVVVYQHLQQNAKKRVGDIERRLAEVSKLLKAPVFAVRLHDLAFLAAAKNSEGARRIRLALQRHAHRHELAFSEVQPRS